ncbi:MAG: YicC/YloC family endoribonuclease [Parvularculaceae bacterium]
MAISSMTGFARLDGSHGETRWTFEIKSVNGRGLEPRFRTPPGFDFLEQEFRKALTKKITRGSINVHLALKGAAVGGALSVNRVALESAIKFIAEIRTELDCDKPRAESILALRGVLEQETTLDDEDERKALGDALVLSYVNAIGLLAASRLEEGRALAVAICDRIDEVEALTKSARGSAQSTLQAIRDRLKAQITELAAAIPEERIAQEAALLAVKADIREELDRLDAHVAAGRSLIAEGGTVGRQLDFLMQEFNREANTLCSKVQDMELKRIGLDMKTVIDQMREQVQNVE